MVDRLLTNERLPIHIIPRIRKQVDRRVRNLLHGPPPPQRNIPHPRRRIRALGQPLHSLRATDWPGRNHVRRQAPGPELDRDAVGHGVHAGFCDTDVRLQRHGGVVDRGGDEDDAAAGAGGGGGFAVGGVGVGGGGKVGEGGFEGVVGA